MSETFARLAASPAFNRFITTVILVAGALVGAQTYGAVMARWGSLLHLIDQLILAVFVLEVVVRMGAHGSKPWRYFQDPWNVFDFSIVAACFLPLNSQYVVILRLARILRTLKLVRALPRLQIIVSALLSSIPSMGYVSLLLFLLFYIYGVTATFLFGANDPIHFQNLQISMVSLFRAATLEDWTDLMYIQMYGCANYGYGGNEALCTQSTAYPVLGALFFISFVLLATMIVLNLFVAVIMNGMTDAVQANKDEQKELQQTELALYQEMEQLAEQLKAVQENLGRLQRMAERGAAAK